MSTFHTGNAAQCGEQKTSIKNDLFLHPLSPFIMFAWIYTLTFAFT